VLWVRRREVEGSVRTVAVGLAVGLGAEAAFDLLDVGEDLDEHPRRAGRRMPGEDAMNENGKDARSRACEQSEKLLRA
jgi:hypothetical protein